MYFLPYSSPTLAMIDLYSFIKMPFQIIAIDPSKLKVLMQVGDDWGKR